MKKIQDMYGTGRSNIEGARDRGSHWHVHVSVLSTSSEVFDAIQPQSGRVLSKFITTHRRTNNSQNNGFPRTRNIGKSLWTSEEREIICFFTEKHVCQ